ncbi:hypothetical protein [Rubrivirga marina]|uniref:Uncharacterized protein n=1 Tax=Rubrivirga marina TaxID=1196024 RepID=A0A271J0T8_9BACT|nr:hypothetical protein [Rubrivirga marina]PAP76980.1 hypothetical protein BSZ37_11325 [Rubrivirga marina]
MPHPSEDFGKPIEQLITEVVSHKPGSIGAERLHALIRYKTAQEVEVAVRELKDATEANAAASATLGRRVFWLNVVLTAATVLAALVALATFLRDLDEPAERPGDLEPDSAAIHELGRVVHPKSGGDVVVHGGQFEVHLLT